MQIRIFTSFLKKLGLKKNTFSLFIFYLVSFSVTSQIEL